MKKTLAILLILVVGMVGVVAANNNAATLLLTTEVGTKYGLIIADRIVTGDTLTALHKDFVEDLSDSSVDTVVFDDDNNSYTLYMNYMSNVVNAATVTASVVPMSSISNATTTKIGYDVVIGTGQGATTHSIRSTDPAATVLEFFDEGANQNGLRILGKEFKITIDAAEWLAAGVATDYQTTWTVTLKTN